MVNPRFSVWRGGMFVFLLPALLLLPIVHLHPDYGHAHGTASAHQRHAVLHADFLPLSSHDHDEHHQSHGVPGDASPQPPAQIGLLTLLPRVFILSAVALDRAFDTLSGHAPLPFLSSSSHRWTLPGDHPPLVQVYSVPPSSPRSPPPFA